MALYCVHCDHTFEPEGSGRPRCPKCMRANDLKGVEASSPPSAPGAQPRAPRAALWVGLLAVAVLGGVGAWLALRTPDPGAEQAGRESAESLRATLAAQGVEAGALTWVEPSEAVAGFAAKVATAEGEAAQVEALVGAIRGRAQAAAFVPWSLGETLPRRVMRPEEVLSVLAKDGGRARLYPLEVVALAAAAARARELPVQVVELTAWPGERAPLDPSGVAGYYALSYDGHVYDVFRGRTVPDGVQLQQLTDAEVIGAGLGLEAVALASVEGETQRATRLSEQALKLAPRSPTLRCVRAAVWATSGAINDALAEFEAAAQLRRDAPRRYHQASAALLTGDAERAHTWLNQLLTEYPDYALARVSVAALEMQRRNTVEATRQLDLAEQAAPDLHAVPWARAELLASQGDTAAAKPLARRAFEGRKTLDSYLRYAQFQRKIGDLDGAAETAVAALEAAPEARRVMLRETFSHLLGPAVMMDVEAKRGGAAASDDSPAGGAFDLAAPRLLGGGDSVGAAAPSGEPGDGPLLMMGDTSKLRLRGQDQGGLKLDLSE